MISPRFEAGWLFIPSENLCALKEIGDRVPLSKVEPDPYDLTGCRFRCGARAVLQEIVKADCDILRDVLLTRLVKIFTISFNES